MNEVMIRLEADDEGAPRRFAVPLAEPALPAESSTMQPRVGWSALLRRTVQPRRLPVG